MFYLKTTHSVVRYHKTMSLGSTDCINVSVFLLHYLTRDRQLINWVFPMCPEGDPNVTISFTVGTGQFTRVVIGKGNHDQDHVG